MYFLAAAIFLASSPILQTGILRQPDESRQQEAPDASVESVDYDQMLREAFELVGDDDLDAALRAFRRVVEEAPPETLAELERKTQAQRGRDLAEIIADARMRVALRGRGSVPLDLTFATDYESLELSRKLDQLCSQLLDKKYGGRLLLAWSEAPEEYKTLAPDAQRMVGDARLAGAAIGARLRFDSRLKTDRVRRRDLVALRTSLGHLVAHVSRMTGYTSLGDVDDKSDPTLDEARRLTAEEKEAEQKAAATQPGKPPD